MGSMKFPAPLCTAAVLPVLFSCAEQVSRIEHVREVPLKTTVVPAEDVGMHRSQATYLLHGAVSQQQRLQRLGQYYFVTWNDANPEQAATLVMVPPGKHRFSRPDEIHFLPCREKGRHAKFRF